MHTNTNTVTQLRWVCSCGATGQWSNRSEDAVRSRWVDHSLYSCPTGHHSHIAEIASRILPGPCAHGRYAECIDCDAATAAQSTDTEAEQTSTEAECQCADCTKHSLIEPAVLNLAVIKLWKGELTEHTTGIRTLLTFPNLRIATGWADIVGVSHRVTIDTDVSHYSYRLDQPVTLRLIPEWTSVTTQQGEWTVTTVTEGSNR